MELLNTIDIVPMRMRYFVWLHHITHLILARSMQHEYVKVTKSHYFHLTEPCPGSRLCDIDFLQTLLYELSDHVSFFFPTVGTANLSSVDKSIKIAQRYGVYCRSLLIQLISFTGMFRFRFI